MIKQQFIDPLPILKKHICARDFDGLKYYLEDILSAMKEFAASQPPTSEPGKVVTGELYRWVKASERLPEKHKDVCFKLDGGSASYYDTGHYTGSYIVLDHFGSKSEDIVEWLEKVEPDWQQVKNQEVEPGQQKETFTND